MGRRGRPPEKSTLLSRRVIELRKAVTIVRTRIYENAHAPEIELLIAAQDALYAAIGMVEAEVQEGVGDVRENSESSGGDGRAVDAAADSAGVRDADRIHPLRGEDA